MYNKIEFRPMSIRFNPGQYLEQCAAIYIDGRDFKEIVKEWELAHNIDNHHSEVNMSWLLDCLKRFIEDEAGNQLYGCQCGEPGCWPFYTRVQETETCITWQGFQQGFREEWDYSDFGPFVFEKDQYEHELAKLEEWIELRHVIGSFCDELTDPLMSICKPNGTIVPVKHVFPAWADEIITVVRKELQIADDKILLFEPYVVPKAVKGDVPQPFGMLIEEQDMHQDYPLLGKASLELVGGIVKLICVEKA